MQSELLKELPGVWVLRYLLHICIIKNQTKWYFLSECFKTTLKMKKRKTRRAKVTLNF